MSAQVPVSDRLRVPIYNFRVCRISRLSGCVAGIISRRKDALQSFPLDSDTEQAFDKLRLPSGKQRKPRPELKVLHARLWWVVLRKLF